MHKLRSLLTMLGIIFGVAAVIAMLSIGAGARQQVMALIEQMGVRNVIVEAHEANAWEDVEKVRKLSLGLTLRDFRVIQSNVSGVCGPQLSSETKVESLPSQDLNNLIYVPLSSAMMRLEDSRSNMRDEIDGIYLQLQSSLDTLPTADVVRSLLNISHRNAAD